MSFLRIGPDDEDDEETRVLDAKVEQVLKDIATTSANAPEAISAYLAELAKGKDAAEIKQALEGLLKAYEELPKLTSILGNWTTTLSAYASYRMLKKQEKIAKNNLRTAQILAGATV